MGFHGRRLMVMELLLQLLLLLHSCVARGSHLRCCGFRFDLLDRSLERVQSALQHPSMGGCLRGRCSCIQRRLTAHSRHSRD